MRRMKYVAFALALFLITSLQCFASGVSPIIEVTSSSGIDELQDYVNTVSNEVGGFSYISVSYTGVGNVAITLDNSSFKALSDDDRQRIMEVALTTISSSNNINGRDRTKLYNFFESQDETLATMIRNLSTDTRTDFITAYSWYKPFSGGLSTVLGIATLGLMLGLMSTIVIDIAYIHGGVFEVLLSGSKEGKPKLVSKEAYSASKIAEADDNKIAMGVYFKKKTITLFFVSLCILYLVGGRIFEVVAKLVNLFNGFIS